MLKKERMFCGVIIKFDFCRKNSVKILTFKMSNINSELCKNVYTMERKRQRNIRKRNLHEEIHRKCLHDEEKRI